MKAKDKTITTPMAMFDQPMSLGKTTPNFKNANFHMNDYQHHYIFFKIIQSQLWNL